MRGSELVYTKQKYCEIKKAEEETSAKEINQVDSGGMMMIEEGRSEGDRDFPLVVSRTCIHR